jgi:hypothetical protein
MYRLKACLFLNIGKSQKLTEMFYKFMYDELSSLTMAVPQANLVQMWHANSSFSILPKDGRSTFFSQTTTCD